MPGHFNPNPKTPTPRRVTFNLDAVRSARMSAVEGGDNVPNGASVEVLKEGKEWPLTIKLLGQWYYGYSDEAIAKKLGLTLNDVKRVKVRLVRAFKARKTLRIVTLAIERGIISVPPKVE